MVKTLHAFDMHTEWAAALQAVLDDQIVKTQSMRASPFIGPLEKEALEWDETLNRLQDVVDNWLACQATWQYLEPIFTSPDIMKQMPEEGDKFLQACAQPLPTFCSAANRSEMTYAARQLGLLWCHSQLNSESIMLLLTNWQGIMA